MCLFQNNHTSFAIILLCVGCNITWLNQPCQDSFSALVSMVRAMCLTSCIVHYCKILSKCSVQHSIELDRELECPPVEKWPRSDVFIIRPPSHSSSFQRQVWLAQLCLPWHFSSNQTLGQSVSQPGFSLHTSISNKTWRMWVSSFTKMVKITI